ncbi:MAG: proline hydroxylase [Alteromonadaceae bacterium]|nr:proline hydroxylase [Alteromonadaceae bacterium]
MDISQHIVTEITEFKEEFNKDRRVRIPNMFSADFANALLKEVANNIKFENAFVHNKQPVSVSDEQLDALNERDRANLKSEIFSYAQNGVGFYYGRCKVSRELTHSPLLVQIYEWLNSQLLFNQIELTTKVSHIKSASAQVTRYNKDCFLTRHNDVDLKEDRKIAYVLNLTPRWHPDWGGLLQFYKQDGTPRDAWAPLFNSLTLFDVTHVHAVTYVAPYAPMSRYAITGWFNGNQI